jgi:hypothetical protein
MQSILAVSRKFEGIVFGCAWRNEPITEGWHLESELHALGDLYNAFQHDVSKNP